MYILSYSGIQGKNETFSLQTHTHTNTHTHTHTHTHTRIAES